MSNNTVKFTVEFDSEAWASMSTEDRQKWVDEANDAINTVAHVSGVEVISKFIPIPEIPLPGQKFDDGTIIASCWQNDDPDPKQGQGEFPWATILLLLPQAPYYVVEDIQYDTEWIVVEGTESNHPNIIPAAEYYSEQIGGY